MDDDRPVSAPYRWTALIGLGWYAVVITAWLVGMFQVSDPHACDGERGMGWCMTTANAAVFGLTLLSPAVLVMIGGMLALAVPISRNVGSPPLAGTLAAAGSAVLGLCLGGAWLVLR
ncbi:hypothetical protein GCM10010168_78380 [Actinoplanes ianthinogenes]|uniref:Uncharacterized protein n=1 Tax=Actinoplanes ianthinogenes TaxID=122358 RepID=A0ABM7LKC4_9ACTN|nr:hypothetical protein [Actinoplanes ianthinogenes]BCJ39706.1 hypothetical protein Aiant_03630 [Actinoplanes ianthinogenes]GGR47985.1 hypothetical protein GCM10010168_78380 [Actinoplanes ianthinogenes]